MNTTVLITGASRGIGKAAAARFARGGCNLALVCNKNIDILEEFAQTLRSEYHVQVLTFCGDVGDYAFVSSVIDSTATEFGHIDILLNNAGISYVGLLTDMTVDDWNRTISTNLSSVFNTCSLCVPSMVSRKNGCIINISSVWGKVGASCEVAYSASKGGVNAFTKALAKELAPSHIRVNGIAFGAIDTDMNSHLSLTEKSALCDEIPAGRMGTPDEAAEFIYRIAFSSDYLNGQVISFDGGWI